MSSPRRQAAAAFAELADALDAADVDLPDAGNGWLITPAGAVLLQLRPLTLPEVGELIDALRRLADDT
ncbi:hypothetical protein [Kitasatospora kifunensis]|uniref:Uncharacterized protein n=1 Tax=Kitasatospora kifunensis TaxID=58351 RepID=A0A7W7R2G2_KITKI|nr:hypothetical protein [Kitasatospora kifunensis]MBB4924217.1 hypothetical protein [Kitasatospora kifunensis]